jgi:hypothetical protein
MEERDTANLLTFTPGAGVVVDLDTLVRTRMLIQASSGGGKSWALRFLLEQTHGAIQQIVIDPEGEFASLRERFPYVLAGPDGDVPIHPENAALLARRLLELNASAVLDLSELEPDDRALVVQRFLDALMHLPRTLWRPLLVAIDEAHVFCPEKGEAPAVSRGAVIALCTRGRKRGFCAVLATQRISKLNNNAAAELHNVLVGRTGLGVDVRRAGDDLGFDKAERLQLKALEPGEFFAVGPAIAREVMRVRTGPVATSHPQPGQITPPPPPAPEALRALIAQLAAVPALGDDQPGGMDRAQPDRLAAAQRRIEALEQQLAARPAPEVVHIAAPMFAPGELEHLTAVVQQLASVGDQVQQAAQQLLGALDRATDGPTRQQAHVPASAPERAAPAPVAHRGRQDEPGLTVELPAPGAKLALAERKILTALAQHGVCPKNKLAVLTGYAVNGGGFRNALSALRTKDYITGSAEIAVTDAGLAALGRWEPLPRGAALIDHWRAQLGRAERLILDTVVATRQPLTAQAIATATGYTAEGGGFRNALSRLRTLQLIEGERDRIRASGSLVEV